MAIIRDTRARWLVRWTFEGFQYRLALGIRAGFGAVGSLAVIGQEAVQADVWAEVLAYQVPLLLFWAHSSNDSYYFHGGHTALRRISHLEHFVWLGAGVLIYHVPVLLLYRTHTYITRFPLDMLDTQLTSLMSGQKC